MLRFCALPRTPSCRFWFASIAMDEQALYFGSLRTCGCLSGSTNMRLRHYRDAALLLPHTCRASACRWLPACRFTARSTCPLPLGSSCHGSVCLPPHARFTACRTMQHCHARRTARAAAAAPRTAGLRTLPACLAVHCLVHLLPLFIPHTAGSVRWFCGSATCLPAGFTCLPHAQLPRLPACGFVPPPAASRLDSSRFYAALPYRLRFHLLTYFRTARFAHLRVWFAARLPVPVWLPARRTACLPAGSLGSCCLPLRLPCCGCALCALYTWFSAAPSQLFRLVLPAAA